MDPPPPEGEKPSQTRRQVLLQGPRPSPLKISKTSHKIKKPPVAPTAAQPLNPVETEAQNRQPVIIYAVSPKVIHTTVGEFMSLVQSLTGSSSSSGGDVSPAARLASIERTSPSEREKSTAELVEMVEGLLDVSHMPGILSPAPATLPGIPSGLFSPRSDPHALSWLHDLSPSIHGNNMFIPSPSTLFSAPMVSPSPSSFDLLNQFLNF